MCGRNREGKGKGMGDEGGEGISLKPKGVARGAATEGREEANRATKGVTHLPYSGCPSFYLRNSKLLVSKIIYICIPFFPELLSISVYYRFFIDLSECYIKPDC